MGPESTADDFTIGGTIQSKKTAQYLNIQTVSTSYKPLVWGATGDTTAWGLEGDTIITVTGSSYGRRELVALFARAAQIRAFHLNQVEEVVLGFAAQVLMNVMAELNFLVCKSSDAGYYDLYLQTGSDTPSGKSCSNFQTIHLPCLC